MVRSAFLLLIIFILACKKEQEINNGQPPPAFNFAKGADISWVTEMETAGRKFYTTSGTETDPFQIMKDLGMNAIRLRAWVNPAGGWNGTADVISKAQRAKNQGMRILLNIHYSDSWADPGQQTKPAAWAGQNLSGLVNSVSVYTVSLMNALKNAGITPEWVQVGNETNDGMLWPEGRASTSMAAFAQLVNAGYDAVKSVSPGSKVMVHISNGHDNALFRWIFDGLKNNNGKWDVTGMSLYPEVTDFTAKNNQCLANMQDMISRYNKEIMIAEVGMSWDQPLACKSFLTDLINKTRTLPGNKGLGVFYWEPQCYGNWKGYTKGAFDNSGRPTIALDAFR